MSTVYAPQGSATGSVFDLFTTSSGATATAAYNLGAFTWSASATADPSNLSNVISVDFTTLALNTITAVGDFNLEPFAWNAQANLREPYTATADWILDPFSWSAQSTVVRQTRTADAAFQSGPFTWNATAYILQEHTATANFNLDPFSWSCNVFVRTPSKWEEVCEGETSWTDISNAITETEECP